MPFAVPSAKCFSSSRKEPPLPSTSLPSAVTVASILSAQAEATKPFVRGDVVSG